MRFLAKEMFMQALQESSIQKAFDRHVQCDRGVLRVCEYLYDLKNYSRVLAVSIGKAGHRMAEILSRQLGSTVQGIVVDPNPPTYQLAGYRYFLGGHPQPNQESIRGADALLKSLSSLDQNSL